jgi:hypothetical protein
MFRPRRRHDLAELAIRELIERGANAAKGFGQNRDQGQTFFGERQAARQASKQLDPQHFFQGFYLMTDRGLRDTQLQTGACEAEMAGGRFKRVKRAEREMRTKHDPRSKFN